MMRRLIIAAVLLASTATAYAQFNGCPSGFCPSGIFGRGFKPPSGAAVVGCTMNGIFDLTNTCNDIYLMGRVL